MRIFKKKRFRVKFRIFDEYTVDVYGSSEWDALVSAVISFDKQKEYAKRSYIRPVKIISVVKDVFSYP